MSDRELTGGSPRRPDGPERGSGRGSGRRFPALYFLQRLGDYLGEITPLRADSAASSHRRDVRKDTQNAEESHPNSGRFAQNYADAEGVVVVVTRLSNGRVVAAAPRRLTAEFSS